MNEKDDFSTDNQLNLRLRGGYEKLAEKILKNNASYSLFTKLVISQTCKHGAPGIRQYQAMRRESK